MRIATVLLLGHLGLDQLQVSSYSRFTRAYGYRHPYSPSRSAGRPLPPTTEIRLLSQRGIGGKQIRMTADKFGRAWQAHS